MKEKNLQKPGDLLPLLVPSAQALACPPISDFRVGAAAVGASGRLYLGCNFEFPGLPLHHSVHAEQFLLANTALHYNPASSPLPSPTPPAATAASSFGSSATQISSRSSSPPIKIPPFPPSPSSSPAPSAPSTSSTPPSPSSSKTLTILNHHHQDDEQEESGFDPADERSMERVLRRAAVEAARRAHAPYSGCKSGFAVGDGEGRVYKGWYAESAAHNPSLGPVQAAMGAYLVGGGEEWEGIVAGVLVEREAAAVSQEGTVRVFFEKVAPKAKIWVHRLGPGEDL